MSAIASIVSKSGSRPPVSYIPTVLRETSSIVASSPCVIPLDVRKFFRIDPKFAMVHLHNVLMARISQNVIKSRRIVTKRVDISRDGAIL